MKHELRNHYFCALLILFWIGFSLFRLSSVPNLHFDEAWAAHFAARISTDSGFWPIHAMSPYTMPWAHYWAAIGFKILGIHLWVYRASQLFLSLGGLCFLALALRRHSSALHGLVFLALVLSCPMYFLNQRFGIELHSIHIFCAGILIWALAAKRYVLALLAALIGVTSHVLFLAFVLGLLLHFFLQVLNGKRAFDFKQRYFLCAFFLSLLPFFIKIYIGVPEKGKALALIAVAAIGALAFAFIDFSTLKLSKIVTYLERVLFWGSIPFLFNLFFYLNGNFVQWAMTGISFHWVLPIIFSLLVLGIFLKDFSIARYFPLAIILLFSGIMMLKPAPRYYELSLITLIFLISSNVVASRFLPGILTLGSLISALILGNGIFSVRGVENYYEVEAKLFLFKESSEDFSPKLEVAKFLGSKGCGFERAQGGDPRILEALAFLSYGDWPVSTAQQCPWEKFRVEKKSMTLAQAGGVDFGQFRIFPGN